MELRTALCVFVVWYLLCVALKASAQLALPVHMEKDPGPRRIQIDFDSVVESFVNKMSMAHGVSVLWYDAYCTSNLTMKEDTKYHNYCVKFSMENMQWGTAQIKKPIDDLFPIWIDNDSDIDQLANYSESITYSLTYSWNVHRSLLANEAPSISVEVPPEFKTSVTLFTALPMNFIGTRSYSEKKTVSTNIMFALPPKSTVLLQLVVEKEHALVAWTADVIISGFIVVKYTQPVDGSTIQFYPISELENKNFQKIGHRLRFKYTGNFDGTRIMKAGPVGFIEEHKANLFLTFHQVVHNEKNNIISMRDRFNIEK